jgi:hypothetical protein
VLSHRAEFFKYGSTIDPCTIVENSQATHDAQCENWLKTKLQELYAPRLKVLICRDDDDYEDYAEEL